MSRDTSGMGGLRREWEWDRPAGAPAAPPLALPALRFPLLPRGAAAPRCYRAGRQSKAGCAQEPRGRQAAGSGPGPQRRGWQRARRALPMGRAPGLGAPGAGELGHGRAGHGRCGQGLWEGLRRRRGASAW